MSSDTAEGSRSGEETSRLAALERELALRTAERDAARQALEKALDVAAVPNAEGSAISARLFAVVTELQRLSGELEQQNAALARSNRELEQQVAERTAVLEAALDTRARSEARFRAVADGVPQLLWTSHPEGRWTFSSSRWQAYTGQSEEQARGMGWLEGVHPDDRQRTLMAWHDATTRHGRLLVEHRIRGTDGQYRWFETQALPAGATFDDPEAEWVGCSSDVHDRRLAEEQLAEARQQLERELDAQVRVTAESAEQFQALFAASAEALFVVEATTDGRLLHAAVNPSFEQLTGIASDQARGREAREFLPGTAARVLEADFRACMADRVPRSFDVLLPLPVGRRALRISLVPMHDASKDEADAFAGLRILGTARVSNV